MIRTRFYRWAVLATVVGLAAGLPLRAAGEKINYEDIAKINAEGIQRSQVMEIMSYLTEELAQSAAKCLRNEVYDVKLKSGDIAESWREIVADDRLRRGPSNIHFAPSAVRRPHDRIRGNLGLKNRRHRLRLSRQA